MLKSKVLLLCILTVLELNADSLGSLLFHGNCITCHHETKSISAPSMLSVRENYLRAFPKKKDFVAYMSKFVTHPNAEDSIMLESIKKYKLMPLLGYEITTIEDIAAYIYDTDFLHKHEGHRLSSP